MVNPQGQAVDSTWLHGGRYFGVVFSVDFVKRFRERTGYVAVLDSLYLLGVREGMSKRQTYDFLIQGLHPDWHAPVEDVEARWQQKQVQAWGQGHGETVA